MKKFVIAILLSLSCLAYGQSVYYVQDVAYNANASDSNAGTNINYPWATWQKAFDTAEAGDTVYFRGGTWYPTTKHHGGDYDAVTIISPPTYGNNGTHDNPIVFMAYPPDYEDGNIPTLDCLYALDTNANVGIAIGTGATNIQLIGLSVRNARMRNPTNNCMGIYASEIGNIYLKNVTSSYNGGPGIWLRGYDTAYVINCDVHHNYDSLDAVHPGGGGDGFALSSRGEATDTFKLTVVTGCRAWNNADDGFDIGSTKQLHVYNNWSFNNGYHAYGYTSVPASGDGVGIKLSYSHVLDASKRRVHNNIFAYNKDRSGTAGGGMAEVNLYDETVFGPVATIYNNFFYNNYTGFGSSDSWSAYSTSYYKDIFTNNIIYGWEGDYPATFKAADYTNGNPSYATLTTNTFILNGVYGNCIANPAYTISNADFISLDTAQLRYDRKPDGSLPDIAFGKLASTSDLIDGGTNVGLVYYGNAPDLGWAEFIPIIADHTVVEKYSDIPQQWIDSVKKMLVFIPGMSHGYGYFRGAELLELLDNKFAVDIWYNTSPPAYQTTALRLGRHGLARENFYTSEDSHEAYKHDYIDEYEYDAMWFGWSYQGTWENGLGGGDDPVFNVQWAGSSQGGPDDNLRWGLDDDDESLTGNSVSMLTYIRAMNEYIAYCETNDYKTQMVFSNGVVDGNGGTELGFQRELKNDYIRNHCDSSNIAVFIDYADILTHNNSGELNTADWNDAGTIRSHQQIHPDNLMDYDESFNIIEPGSDAVEDHIGEVGALRLAKAMWWMLARIAGWDGLSTSEVEPSTATDIIAFSFAEQTGAAIINATNHTVLIEVEYGSNISALVPTITLSNGATIDPASGVARDFHDSVTYTVTAEDGEAEQVWTVTVTVDSAPTSSSDAVKIGDSIILYNGVPVKI
jgi:hypothetical protein